MLYLYAQFMKLRSDKHVQYAVGVLSHIYIPLERDLKIASEEIGNARYWTSDVAW